ncbi:MAG: Uma2 family endonuclease [Bacteroidota bacterium]
MTLTVNINDLGPFTDEQFIRFCSANDTLRIERDADGHLILMAPSGTWTGFRNARVLYGLLRWNEKHKAGYVFDSSAGFQLANGAMRAPDAAWISHERWATVPEGQRETFAPVCPDVVVEVLSPSDSLADTKRKMEEWMANGCRLAWLIAPKQRTAIAYRAGAEPQPLTFDDALDGGAVMPGFRYELNDLP